MKDSLEATNGQNRIELIDAFRAIAVMSVICYHYYYRFSPPFFHVNLYHYQFEPNILTKYGYYGVSLFFIISGFVISRTLENCVSFRTFITKRFIRLMPSLLLCALITFFLEEWAFYNFSFPQTGSYLNFLPSLTFTPSSLWNFLLARQDITYIDGVYWTLFVEMTFYLISGVVFFLQPNAFLRNWVGITAVATLIRIVTSPKTHFLFPDTVAQKLQGIYDVYIDLQISYWVYFALGIFFYYLFSKQRKPVVVSALVLLLVLCEFYFLKDTVVRTLFAGVISLFLIFIDKPQWLFFLRYKPVLLSGMISYPLYLIHQDVGLLLMNKIAAVSEVTGLNKYIPLVVILIMSLGAYLIYAFFETPVIAFIKRRVWRSQKTRERKAVILFYSPFNQRSRDTESLMIGFRQQGHRVISLSQQEGLVIHDLLRLHHIETYAHVLPGPRSGWWYYLRHLLFFIRFCWKHKVEVVYSHLEPANFVASLGQYFIRARTYLCRHHIDEGKLYSFDKDLYYRLTYRLARHVIVVSEHARRYMIEREHIPAVKIRHINLAYDFTLYLKPDDQKVAKIKKDLGGDLLFVSACRLTKYKRPDEAIKMVKALVDQGLNAKLVILGKGEMYDDLLAMVGELKLTDHVQIPGFVDNVLEYMAAADFFIHPSLLDSSCVAVKEAGLVSKPVVVCRGVGDFDDYIIDGENGFLVSPDGFAAEAAAIVRKYTSDKAYLEQIGHKLNADVMRLFDVNVVLKQYGQLNKSH